MHVFLCFLARKCKKWHLLTQKRIYCLKSILCRNKFFYTYLSSFRNLSFFHLRNRKPAFRGTKCYIFKILKSDVQFLKNVKFVSIVCLTVLKDVYISRIIMPQKTLIFFLKKKIAPRNAGCAPHGMQVSIRNKIHPLCQRWGWLVLWIFYDDKPNPSSFT